MPSMYTGGALENWKRFGGGDNVVASYAGPTGSSASLQQPYRDQFQVAPTPNPIFYGDASGHSSAAEDAGIDYGDANIEDRLKAQKAALDASKPGEVSATYQGPEAMSMNWGGSLIGGTRTGVQDYGKWQSDRGTYEQAMQNWQKEYSQWAQGQKQWDDMRARNTAGQTQPQQPQQPAGQGWGRASTQQENLGQSQTTQAPSPYAVPGQRSTQQPGVGPVRKPDKSLGQVNDRYAGVL